MLKLNIISFTFADLYIFLSSIALRIHLGNNYLTGPFSLFLWASLDSVLKLKVLLLYTNVMQQSWISKLVLFWNSFPSWIHLFLLLQLAFLTGTCNSNWFALRVGTMESLAQLEVLCQRLYTSQDSVERAHAESALKCFSDNSDYIAQCQYILDNASTPYALMLASSSLLKQVAGQTLSLQLRLDIRKFLFFWLHIIVTCFLSPCKNIIFFLFVNVFDRNIGLPTLYINHNTLYILFWLFIIA